MVLLRITRNDYYFGSWSSRDCLAWVARVIYALLWGNRAMVVFRFVNQTIQKAESLNANQTKCGFASNDEETTKEFAPFATRLQSSLFDIWIIPKWPNLTRRRSTVMRVDALRARRSSRSRFMSDAHHLPEKQLICATDLSNWNKLTCA